MHRLPTEALAFLIPVSSRYCSSPAAGIVAISFLDGDELQQLIVKQMAEQNRQPEAYSTMQTV
jgi:hypothetical protein